MPQDSRLIGHDYDDDDDKILFSCVAGDLQLVSVVVAAVAAGPVVGSQVGGVDLAGGLAVEDGQALLGGPGLRVQAQDGGRAEAVHRRQPEVAVEVPGVDAGEREAVSVSGHGHAACADAARALHARGPHVCLVLGLEHRLRRRGVQVVEGVVDEPARDAAAAVADADGEVLGALDDGDLDGRVVGGVLAVVLDGGAHGVLEELEEDVVDVRGHVRRLDVVLGGLLQVVVALRPHPRHMVAARQVVRADLQLWRGHVRLFGQKSKSRLACVHTFTCI